MTDVKRLDELIKQSDYPINVIASKMGITTQALHSKRIGKREFSIREMLELCDILQINKSEREKIFFTTKSEKFSPTQTT